LTKPSLNFWKPLTTLGGYVISLCFFLILGAYLSHQHHFFYGFLLSVLAATRFRALGNLMHECVHGTLFRSKGSNRVCGFFISLLLWCSYKDYAQAHISHHRFLGDPNKDQDMMRMPPHWWKTPNPKELCNLVIRLRFLRIWIMNNEWQPFYKYESAYEKAIRALFVIAFLAFLGFSSAFYHVPIFTLFTFLVPYQIHKYICDLYDHGGLMQLSASRNKSRNHPIKSPDFLGSWAIDHSLNALFLPRNDGLHQAHHIKPNQTTPKATKGIDFPRGPV
jgi:fatty acid desaturase